MDECEGRISARELVARRCWASVRSSATPAIRLATSERRNYPAKVPRIRYGLVLYHGRAHVTRGASCGAKLLATGD